MLEPPFRGAVSLAILAPVLACAPAVYTQTRPGGLTPTGTLITYGQPETHLVTLTLKRRDGAPSWKGAFVDGTPEAILAEDIPGATLLKWKVDPVRMRTLTTQPFRLRIRGGEAIYETTVSFSSAERDFTGQLLLNVVAHLIAGR